MMIRKTGRYKEVLACDGAKPKLRALILIASLVVALAVGLPIEAAATDNPISVKSTLAGPSGSIDDPTPTFSWTPVEGATKYRLQVYDATAGSYPINTTTTSASFTPGSELQSDHSFVWWVQAGNAAGWGPWSSGLRFTLAVVVTERPTPVSPSGKVAEATPTFSWSKVTGASKYVLQVYDRDAGAYPINTITTSTNYTPPSAPPPDHRFVWWVQAGNAAGWGPWSGGMHFATAVDITERPTLSNPSGGISDTTPTFSWSGVSGATEYVLQAYDRETGAYPINTITTETSYTPSVALSLGHSFVWWVQAGNAAGWGPWSSGMRFALEEENRKPEVQATVVPTGGQVPLDVHLEAQATDPDGDTLSVEWDLGDGIIVHSADVYHTYTGAGDYEAKVTATDTHGAFASQSVVISVAPAATADLDIQHANRYPTRLAQGPQNKIYVSDAKVGSVFVYTPELHLIGEIKDLDLPLGVAVDDYGRIYVGNDGRDNVEVYSASGAKLLSIDDGFIQKPNDLAIDREGNIYVADSLANMVRVYAGNGQWLRDIGGPGDGDGNLLFPAALTIAYRVGLDGQEVGELYVADQGHAKVQVFSLDGAFLRAYGSAVPDFSDDWQGKFVKLQSLAVDGQGRLHAADCYMNKVQILNADTGEYLSSYGTFGTGVGELNLPLDIAITIGEQVVVANAENHRVEYIYTLP